MKPLENKELLGKFWNGETSLKEEEHLKKVISADDGVEAKYFDFLKSEKDQIVDLESEIWEKIEKKSGAHQKQKRIRMWTAAASVLILISISVSVLQRQQKARLEKQFALIEQTLNHVSGELTESVSNEVLYQDEFIKVVAEN